MGALILYDFLKFARSPAGGQRKHFMAGKNLLSQIGAPFVCGLRRPRQRRPAVIKGNRRTSDGGGEDGKI